MSIEQYDRLQLETDSLEFVFIHIEETYKMLGENIEHYTIYIGNLVYFIVYKLKLNK